MKGEIIKGAEFAYHALNVMSALIGEAGDVYSLDKDFCTGLSVIFESIADKLKIE